MKFDEFLSRYRSKALTTNSIGVITTLSTLKRGLNSSEKISGNPIGEIEIPTHAQLIKLARHYEWIIGDRASEAVREYLKKYSKAIAAQYKTAEDIVKLVSDVILARKAAINIAHIVIRADLSRIQGLFMRADQLLDLYRVDRFFATSDFKEAFDGLNVPLECYADLIKLAETFHKECNPYFERDNIALRKRLIPSDKAVSLLENARQFIQLSQCSPPVAEYLLSEQGIKIAALFNTVEEILDCFSVNPKVGNALLPFIDWKKIASLVTSYNQFQEIKRANANIADQLLWVDGARLTALTPLPSVIKTEESVQEDVFNKAFQAHRVQFDTLLKELEKFSSYCSASHDSTVLLYKPFVQELKKDFAEIGLNFFTNVHSKDNEALKRSFEIFKSSCDRLSQKAENNFKHNTGLWSYVKPILTGFVGVIIAITTTVLTLGVATYHIAKNERLRSKYIDTFFKSESGSIQDAKNKWSQYAVKQKLFGDETLTNKGLVNEVEETISIKLCH